MAWAALGKKLATGMVKGKAKKVATDKLLNRKKKKPVAKRPTLDQLIEDVRGGGAEQTKGGALAIRPTTSLVPTAPSVATGGGGDTDIEGIPVINLMDVLSLLDYLISGNSYECQDPIMNINGDAHVNIVDAITLVQTIMNGGE